MFGALAAVRRLSLYFPAEKNWAIFSVDMFWAAQDTGETFFY